MASTHLSAAELLALEERQLLYYLTDVPGAGAWVQALPPHLPASCIALAAQLPLAIDRILARLGSPEAFAQRMRRVLSPAAAPQIAGAALRCTWGREMSRGQAGDARCGEVLRFCYDVTRHYRSDGEPHPDDAAGLGSNYRILAAEEAQGLAQRCTRLGVAQGETLIGLMEAVSALSMRLEAGTRAGLMMHGPYPTGARGVQLVVLECADLRGSQAVQRPFPYPGLAVVLQVRDCDIQADRFGRLHIQPWTARHVVAGCLLANEEATGGLVEIPLERAGELHRCCDGIRSVWQQAFDGWDAIQRGVVCVWQEQRLIGRLLAAAGFAPEEIDAAHLHAERASGPIVERYVMQLDRERPDADVRAFFARLRGFVAGTEPHLFTPFDGSAATREPRRGPTRVPA
jgi:hypothetical protein